MQTGGALPKPDDECAIGRPSSKCLLEGELETLASIVEKLGSSHIRRGDGKKILEVLMRETQCDSEECVICEITTRVEGTPYESIVTRIRELAFKPKGPQDLDALLDNFILMHLGLQVEAGYPGVKFGGVLTYDFMINPVTSVFGYPQTITESYSKTKWDKLQFILNMDHRMGVGTHWVALCINTKDGQMEYTDSYGRPPSGGLIQSSRVCPPITDERGRYVSLLVEWINSVQTEFIKIGVMMKFVYNERQHQEVRDKSNCGVYAALAIIASAENQNFFDFNSRHISMNQISSIRERLYKRTPGYRATLPKIALQ